MHELAIPELGRVAPHGVYDLVANSGWVSVGLDHDTASFAVETSRRWWHAMGQERYPEAQQLIITADMEEAMDPGYAFGNWNSRN